MSSSSILIGQILGWWASNQFTFDLVATHVDDCRRCSGYIALDGIIPKTVNPPVDVKKRTILSTGAGMGRSQYQEVSRENSRKETFIPRPRPPTVLVHIHLSFSSYIFIHPNVSVWFISSKAAKGDLQHLFLIPRFRLSPQP
jgi:hypothetical protein